MPTDVVMPQMGESIAEGTIVRWIKISTDKVDAEIPAPAAGVVTEIRHKEGETVPVNTVVAVIGQAMEQAAPSTPATRPSAPPSPPPPPAPQADGAAAPPSATEATPPVSSTPPQSSAPPAGARESQRPRPQAVKTDRPQAAQIDQPSSTEAAIRQRSSPLVRKIAREHDIDISQLRGTGISGRVTKNDILGFLGQVGQVGQVGREGTRERVTPPGPVAGEVVKMSVMRKRIAEHMIASRRTSAHVHSVFEVDFTRVAKLRELKKKEYEASGAKLTFLSFILRAVVEALRAVPVVNASIDGENVVYHKDVNIGVAVALDWGLIVPVIKHAEDKNLFALSVAVADLASRGRAKQLKPEEVSGGTFTITNPGVFGALFGMPIINQPQVAILGVGNIEKRPIVIDDAIAIRTMGYLTLGYDHRLIDGAVADEFLSHVKHTLENWDPESA